MGMDDLLPFTTQLRQEFAHVLSGPGISWNKKGIMTALERAMTETLLKLRENENKHP